MAGWIAGLLDIAKGGGAKAQPRVQASMVPVEKAKGQLLDPLSMMRSGAGYYYRPTSLSYEALRAIGYNTPILKAIIHKRLSQMAACAKRPRSEYDLGIKVGLRDRNAKMTTAAQKQATFIEDWLLHCGIPGRDRAVTDDNFRAFTVKVVRDSLLFDQLNFQVRPRRDGKPYEMIAMPAMSLRLRELSVEEEAKARVLRDQFIDPTDADAPRYVQVYQNVVIAEFTPRELAWGVRNPVTDIDHFGYGWTEIENLIAVIQALHWAEGYNRKFFSQGSGIKGILNIKGDIPQRNLEAFRNEWHHLISGVENAFRTPVVSAADLQWIEMHSTNKEMEFGEWLDYNIKIVCAEYQIDPGEINFYYGNAGGQKTMFENSQEAKLKYSKDGLKPVVATYEDVLNSHVVQQLDVDFEVRVVGLDGDDERDRLSMAKDYVANFRTIDEVRATYNLKPLPDGMGKVILSPTWMQVWTMAQQKQQQAGGQPPDGGDQDAGADPDFDAADFGDPASDDTDAQAQPDQGAPGDQVDAAAGQDSGVIENPSSSQQPSDVQKSQSATRKRKAVRVITVEV